MDELKTLVSHENNDLLDVILDANFNHWIWWIYVGPDRPKYASTLNEYLAFFSNSIRAHFFTLIISLYKLYDTNKATNNFNRLLKLVKNNTSFSQDEIRAIEDRFMRALLIWKKVKILRHNYFAHLKFNVDTESIYKEANITPNEFKELINLSMEMSQSFF